MTHGATGYHNPVSAGLGDHRNALRDSPRFAVLPTQADPVLMDVHEEPGLAVEVDYIQHPLQG